MKLIYCLLLLGPVFYPALEMGRYFTKNGKISLYSSSPLEDIRAQNNSATCVLDAGTGDIQLAVLMKGFEFKKALMQEHFNEDYVESDKYPRAVFKGKVLNNNAIQYTKDGVYDGSVKGTLTLHGETREVEASGKIEVKGTAIHVYSEFMLLLSDYRIGIPAIARNNVSNKIKITVDCVLGPLKA